MAIFSALLFLTYRAQAPVISSPFTPYLWGCFDCGSGKWFYFPDDRRHLSPVTIYRVKIKGGSDEQAQKEASPKRRRLWALSQPLAQWAAFYSAGVWHVAQYDRLSGRRDEVFLIFYIVCVLLTWLVYGRGSSAKNKRSMPDVQPCRIRQASDPNSFLEQESCHE